MSVLRDDDPDDCLDPIGHGHPILDPPAGSPLNDLIASGVREAEAVRYVARRVELGLAILDLAVPGWESAFDHGQIKPRPFGYSPLPLLYPSDTLVRAEFVLGLEARDLADYGFLAVAEMGTPQFLKEIKFLAHEWKVQLCQRMQSRSAS